MSDDILRRLKRQHHNTNVLDGDLMREAAAEIEKLRKDNRQLWASLTAYANRVSELRLAMHDIYEVYAGSEGFIPQTCPEAYLQQLVKEMAEIAAKHKRDAPES